MSGTLGLGATQLVLYHLVIDGGAVVDLEDGSPIQLRPGDVVIFPHGHAHHMSSDPGVTRPFPNYGITAKIKARDLSPLHAGGGGQASRFVCGYNDWLGGRDGRERLCRFFQDSFMAVNQ
jgi:hypothetical protein